MRSLGARDLSLFDEARATEWIEGAPAAARSFEEIGVIRWEVIPDYPDYYFPTVAGSKATGRYLTGAPFDGSSSVSGELPAGCPAFPERHHLRRDVLWGGIASRTEWDHELLADRRASHVLTFGQGIAAAFLAAVIDRRIPILIETTVTALSVDDEGVVCGVEIIDADELESSRVGQVVLAPTGVHDWSPELSEEVHLIRPMTVAAWRLVR